VTGDPDAGVRASITNSAREWFAREGEREGG
jgi:hypothetical protein